MSFFCYALLDCFLLLSSLAHQIIKVLDAAGMLHLGRKHIGFVKHPTNGECTVSVHNSSFVNRKSFYEVTGKLSGTYASLHDRNITEKVPSFTVKRSDAPLSL